MIVALYARVSTSKQAEKDLSIPDQLSQMRSWCQAGGHTVAVLRVQEFYGVREHVELGSGGPVGARSPYS